MNTNKIITPAELVRMPVGTKETYTMYPGEISYFLRKLSTYALRANAKLHHKIATVIWDDEDMVSRMVVVKVLRKGKQLKRKRSTSNAE